MYPYEFAYWLKGYFELSNSSNLSEEQVKIIKEHLQKVFSVSSGTAGIQMHPDEFVYWLKGYFELSNSSNLSEEQVKIYHQVVRVLLEFKHLAVLVND